MESTSSTSSNAAAHSGGEARGGGAFSPLAQPFWTELEEAQSVLIAGCGGGYDVFSGLPLFFALHKMVSLPSTSLSLFLPLSLSRLHCAC
jgi:hypothetical protein